MPDVVSYIVLKWPTTSQNKQVIFFNRLMNGLLQISPVSAKVLVPHLRRIVKLGRTATSEKLALAFIEFFSGADGDRLLKRHGQILIPVFAPVFFEMSLEHWSPIVLQSALLAMTALRREDAHLVDEVLREHNVSGTPPQVAKWMYVFKAAHRENPDVSVSQQFGYLTELFPARRERVAKTDCGPFGRARATSERVVVVKPKLAARAQSRIL
jgi:hypothetical protein